MTHSASGIIYSVLKMIFIDYILLRREYFQALRKNKRGTYTHTHTRFRNYHRSHGTRDASRSSLSLASQTFSNSKAKEAACILETVRFSRSRGTKIFSVENIRNARKTVNPLTLVSYGSQCKFQRVSEHLPLINTRLVEQWGKKIRLSAFPSQVAFRRNRRMDR